MVETAAAAGFDLRKFTTTALGSNPDDSAPLSASDLRILSENLHARSNQLKLHLRQILSQNYDQFHAVVDDAQHAADGAASLADDVTRIFHALDGEVPFDSEICRLAGKAQELRNELEERRAYLVALEFIARVREGLKSAESLFYDGEFVGSGTKLLEIREELELPVDWTDEDRKGEKVQAFRLLEDEWASSYSKLGNFLEELFAKAVAINVHDCELRIDSRVSCGDSKAGVNVNGVQLSTILSAMDNIGVLDTRLAQTADLLFKQIVDPIVQDPGFAIDTKELDQQGRAVISWNSSTSKTDAMGHAEIFSKLLQLFKFLRTNLLVDNDEWMAHLGRVIWPQLTESITRNYLSKAVPIEISELANFQELAQATAEFETSLGRLGLIPEWVESRGDKLRSFSSDVEYHFAVKKRKSVMTKARDLLIKSDYKAHVANQEGKTIQIGDDIDNVISVQTEAFSITLTVKQLLEIVHHTLQDACKSTPVIAMELYLGARDAVLLYLAIVPVKVMEHLNSIHKVAVLCHNDCLHVAQHVLQLHFQYYPALPSNVQKIMAFVDLAPLFRKQGSEILQKQMHLITGDLMEVLDRANGFQYLEQRKNYETCSNAIGQAVHVLETVQTVWQPVLAASVYKPAFEKLVNAVVTRLINEVLGFDDISVEEGEKLRELMLAAVSSIKTLFGPATKEVDDTVDDDPVSVPTWRKLLRLTDLLDMSLRPITQSWESGDLHSCGFTAEEVQHLVKAIFSDTPLRSECLQVIVDKSTKKR